VAAVIRVNDEADAIRIANASPYGLGRLFGLRTRSAASASRARSKREACS